jgi:urease accessory protein
MGWRGHLSLHYRMEGARTVALDRHEGPLRVLQRLYPEGDAVCHHVLVHPPGGIAGGDELEIDARLEPGTHALLTTPGATRYYRSSGPLAAQRARLQLAGGARLEWLPLETIAYSGCVAENQVRLALEPGAEAMGWDVLALGLPASGEAFANGSFLQHLELEGNGQAGWLERGRVEAADQRLLDSPLGWDGLRVFATMWFARGSAWPVATREALLEGARAACTACAASGLAARAGATAAHDRVVVLRVLGARVEPVMALLTQVRAAWRAAAWDMADERPRVWQT